MSAASPVDSLSDQLREVLTVWGQSQQRLVALAAEFADSGESVLDGFATAAHWIAEVADCEVCTAREWIRIGRRLRELPASADAFASGQLSYSKIRSLTRVATPDNERELLDLALGVPAGQLNRAIAAWMTRNLDPDDLDEYHQQHRSIRWRAEPDGMTVYTLRLPPLLTGKLEARLTGIVLTKHAPREKKRSDASAGAWPTLAQQYADALDQLLTAGAGPLKTEVVLHVRGDGCTLDNGTPVPDSVVERIAPQSFIRALVHDAEGRPINASKRQRHPTTRQKRVVRERDKACIDCGRTDLIEYDHVPSYQESGQTVVGELQTRCAVCHHRRHGYAAVG